MIMKKTILYSVALALATMLTGCFDDDSQMASDTIRQTTISGIEESYVKTAYVGEHLVINPEVTASYADDQMTYTWLLLNEDTGTKDDEGNEVQPTVIGNTRNLDYEVQLPPGSYQVRFLATAKDNGYTAQAMTKLSVRTLFSQGFYILKETTDGKTEIDLLTLDGQKGNNQMTQVNGAPMDGRPVSLYPNYNMYYINPDNDQMEATNSVTITTDKLKVGVFRSSDFKPVITRDNLMYDKMDANEKVYGTFSTAFGYTVLLTSTGLYKTSAKAAYQSPSTGQFGLPISECGGSPYFFSDCKHAGGGALWDERSHSLTAFDYNFGASPLLYADLTGMEDTQNLSTFDCLHCGFSSLAGTATGTFILEDKTSGKRYLYLISSSFFGSSLEKRVEIPAGSHAAKATAFSTNSRSASYIYCVDGGKVYALIFNSDDLSEIALKFDGIGEGEQVSYVANQYWSPMLSTGDTFDYLVVATQKSGQYKLHFYNMNGGAPVGSPVLSTEGEGTVRKVRYLNEAYDFNDSRITYPYTIND